jgi:hypothetical protein
MLFRTRVDIRNLQEVKQILGERTTCVGGSVREIMRLCDGLIHSKLSPPQLPIATREPSTQVAERPHQLLSTREDAAQQIEKAWWDIDQILFDFQRTAQGICNGSGGNEKDGTDRRSHQ